MKFSSKHIFNYYSLILNIFRYLPLAALIENKVLCVSGGLGKNLNYISQIESI
jgi:diadenosine tetraphosphatase ApaH/serine/threonine PP2A family protein phosphatase